jgi:response regulator RpfG family c-di-GMP phosphodiesterase
MASGVTTVLVVDDEKAIRSAMSRALRDHCRVLVAESVDDALTRMKAEPVDIVLADYSMPGGTGEDLLRAVSRDYPAVRRALVSGTPPDDLEALLRGGLVEVFVAKPWTVDEIVGVVKRLSGA